MERDLLYYVPQQSFERKKRDSFL
jgi:hypothetical protein